jgi:hypothetical protein
MDVATFKASLGNANPPEGLNLAAQALWWDARGDWEKAHSCAQKQADAFGAWVHAYLHRKEGDAANAGYWYHRAGKPAVSATLHAEWADILRAVLKDAKRDARTQA